MSIRIFLKIFNIQQICCRYLISLNSDDDYQFDRINKDNRNVTFEEKEVEGEEGATNDDEEEEDEENVKERKTESSSPKTIKDANLTLKKSEDEEPKGVDKKESESESDESEEVEIHPGSKVADNDDKLAKDNLKVGNDSEDLEETTTEIR